MARKPKSKLPIDLSANATATAEAKLIIERKKVVTEVIPPDVTRANATAWLTLISPLTQWAGLKGDQLRHKRELLHIFQEETLNEITAAARAKIGSLDKQGGPAPLKFIVPFLEKASVEGADPELRDLWASLLASAYKNYRPEYVHFCNIIAQMSASQARAFSAMLQGATSRELDFAMDNIRITYTQGMAKLNLVHHLDSLDGKPSGKRLAKALSDWLDKPGLGLVNALVDLPSGAMRIVNPKDDGYKDDLEVDYNILEALGLVERVEIHWFEHRDWGVTCIYYALRPLGFHFAMSAGLTHP